MQKLSKLHPNYKIIIRNAPELLINSQKCPRTMQKLPKLPRFLFFAPIKNKTEDRSGFWYYIFQPIKRGSDRLGLNG